MKFIIYIINIRKWFWPYNQERSWESGEGPEGSRVPVIRPLSDISIISTTYKSYAMHTSKESTWHKPLPFLDRWM